MKRSLLCIFGAACFFAAAQPTLTATGINPVVGDVYTNTSSTVATSPGNAGANQTWNITLTGSASSTTVVAASSTSYSASFPGANLAAGTSTIAYYKTSAAAWQLYGAQQGTVTISYSNPEDFLHYPFTYNNTFMDTWGSTFVNAGTTYYRSGHDTITADGYGTLTTPDGTFSNVLRVHLIQNYQDSADFGGTPFIIPYRNDEYLWFLNGNHSPIAATYTFTTSGFTTNSTQYLNNVAVGIKESQDEANSLYLFPNPASNLVHLNLNLDESQRVEVKLFNAAGNLVNGGISRNGFAGNNDYDINVSTLPEGIYLAEIKLDGRAAATRRFVISR